MKRGEPVRKRSSAWARRGAGAARRRSRRRPWSPNTRARSSPAAPARWWEYTQPVGNGCPGTRGRGTPEHLARPASRTRCSIRYVRRSARSLPGRLPRVLFSRFPIARAVPRDIDGRSPPGVGRENRPGTAGQPNGRRGEWNGCPTARGTAHRRVRELRRRPEPVAWCLRSSERTLSASTAPGPGTRRSPPRTPPLGARRSLTTTRSNDQETPGTGRPRGREPPLATREEGCQRDHHELPGSGRWLRKIKA